MTGWARTGLSILLGALIWLGVTWAFKQPIKTISISSEFWISFDKVVGSSFQWMFLKLAPWFIVGITAARHPIFSGAFAATLAWLVHSYPQPDWVTSEYATAYLATSLGLALVNGAYGAAGAAVGVALQSANNSFKPNPLRGSA